MPGEWVLDASLVAATLFEEKHSEIAMSFLSALVDEEAILIAPDLLALEIASISAKKIWRGETSEQNGAAAVIQAVALIDDSQPTGGLVMRAHALAARHRFSAYDATYLALAEARGAKVATLDAKFVRRAEEEGFSGLLHLVG